MEKDTTEIEKLTERIAKDPKSKLFVPLAEEYKKTGDIEMAIRVLSEGLKNNPGYVTARSSLGRLLIERGDLDGARKELEEVIKAIPDNLLAQRKLGEIYVLQGKSGDALQRFKTCLSLNPGDKDLTALVADLEAGKDVSLRIPRPKLAVQPAEAAKPVVSPVATKPQPPADRPVPVRAGTPPSAPVPPASPETVAPPSSPAPELRDAAETVEEIVVLEPLDHAAVPAATTDIAPAAAATEPQPVLEIPGAGEFSLAEAAIAEPALAGEEWPAAAEPPVAPDVPEAAVAPSVEEQTDDINTNTLAELYIAQGFYDKAIEIYQGMLAEHPSNPALLQKLEKLGAMAEAAARNATFGAKDAAPKAYAPPVQEPVTAAEDRSVPPPAGSPAAAETTPSATRGVEPADTGELRGRAEVFEVPHADDSSAPPAPKPEETRRKETIDRLESWLKNIIKEKT